MASFTCKTLTLFVICTALQEGCGLPLSEQPAQAPHPPRIRTKRCSCNNWDDKECIYFCHLDIIWVNTPSKLLPYGLGSSPSRHRRSANRCECLNAADKTCHGFCLKSSEDLRTDVAEPLVKSGSVKSNTLWASFSSDHDEHGDGTRRSVVKEKLLWSQKIKEQNEEVEGRRKSITTYKDHELLPSVQHIAFKMCPEKVGKWKAKQALEQAFDQQGSKGKTAGTLPGGDVESLLSLNFDKLKRHKDQQTDAWRKITLLSCRLNVTVNVC